MCCILNGLNFKNSNVKVGNPLNIVWMFCYFGDPLLLNNVFIILIGTQVYVTKSESPADNQIKILGFDCREYVKQMSQTLKLG